MEKERKSEEKKETTNKKDVKKYKLIDFFGRFSGQIFGDDAVFNLEMKPDAILR